MISVKTVSSQRVVANITRLVSRAFAYLLREPYECAGAFFGGFGAWLLSANISYSKWGWLSFLLSNAFFLVVAYRKRMSGLFMVQSYFAYTSVNGILHYF
ncbi:hypothetical protein LP417_35045 (plasmid) [Polaromonas sp. P1-6]|nr:hypothetical protein LP417_35045 [Polaromonas sp. P1-6]